jgi:hypothetical protein
VPHAWKDLQPYFLTAVIVPQISSCALFPRATKWYGHGINPIESKLPDETHEVLARAGRPMPVLASPSAILPISGLPDGVDVHWETQRRVVWNAREHSIEEHELVYEISWIKELGLWRTFLRSHHKVND